MSTATVQLAQFLFACFAAGCAITWALQQRRFRRERQELEQSMTRALQSRYSVYESLEQSVLKLMNRFDAVEREFRARLEEAAKPGIVLQQTVALRSQNPELWDLERENQRVQAQQQADLAQQRARVVELMGQLETLEPGKLAVASELASVQTRYENAVANAKDAELAISATVGRLQGRVRELEPLESMLEASRREASESLDAAHGLAIAKDRLQQRVAELEPLEAQLEACRRELVQSQNVQQSSKQAYTSEIAGLQTELTFLRPLEAQIEQFHAEFARRQHDAELRANEYTALLEERERERTRWKSDVEKSSSRIAQLEKRCESFEQDTARSQQELEEVAQRLEATRSAQAQTQREYDHCRSDLAQAEERSKLEEALLADATAMTASLRRELETVQQSLVEKSKQGTQLERELQSSKTALETVHQSLAEKGKQQTQLERELQSSKAALEAVQQSLAEKSEQRTKLERELQSSKAALETARSAAQAGQTKTEGLELALVQARAELAKAKAQSQDEIAKLNSALGTTQSEIERQRERISAHSHHVEAAWSVLSELKPMLASLELNLKVDQTTAAAPAGGMDLSILDDPVATRPT